MKWVGLTGGIASGKSSVSEILVCNGISVVDADLIAHQAFEPNSPTFHKTVERFGTSILSENGDIDRGLLGAIVFRDESGRKALEEIVHPFVQRSVKAEKDRLTSEGKAWAVYDVPLLFEKKMESQFHQIIVVGCELDQQVLRLQERNGFSKENALRRIRSQLPLSEKRGACDFYIDNSGPIENLETLVKNIIETLNKQSK